MKLKTFRTLQYNITWILHINSSMFCFVQFMVLIFLRHTQKFKDKSLLSLQKKKKKVLFAQFLVKFVMLPMQSIVLENWFACVPAWLHERNLVGLIDGPECKLQKILYCLYQKFKASLESWSKTRKSLKSD